MRKITINQNIKPRHRERRVVTAYVIVAVMLAGFFLYRAFTAPEREAVREARKNVDFVTIEKGSVASGRAEKESVIASSLDEWQALWAGVRAPDSKQAPPLPRVDFAKYTVIAVFQGAAPSGGYSIAVTEVKEEDDSVKITVKESMPGDTCPVIEMITYPYHIVRVPRILKPVELRSITEPVECRKPAS